MAGAPGLRRFPSLTMQFRLSAVLAQGRFQAYLAMEAVLSRDDSHGGFCASLHFTFRRNWERLIRGSFFYQALRMICYLWPRMNPGPIQENISFIGNVIAVHARIQLEAD